MLCTFTELSDFEIRGREDTLGSLEDCVLAEEDWSVKYLTAKTGNWLTGRSVLIKEDCVTTIDPGSEVITVALTQESFKNQPDKTADPSVSLKKQKELVHNYAWAGSAGAGFIEIPSAALIQATEDASDEEASEGANLRSAKELIGYSVHAGDVLLGKVSEIMIDPVAWSARFLAIKRGKSGDIVTLIPCAAIDKVKWSERDVRFPKSILEHLPDTAEAA